MNVCELCSRLGVLFCEIANYLCVCVCVCEIIHAWINPYKICTDVYGTFFSTNVWVYKHTTYNIKHNPKSKS